MIQQEDVIALLVKTSPGFKPDFEKLEKEWGDELKITPYIPVGHFAQYLVGLLNDGDTKDFSKVFETVERIIKEGDKRAGELIVVGLLEDLQNILSHSLVESKAKDKELDMILKINQRGIVEDNRFIKWFGPETKKAWDGLIEGWKKINDAKARGLI